MNYYWSMLCIAPTSDLKAVKRAYATQLKAHRPEDNAEHFQRLREAYEWVCKIGIHCFDDEEDEVEEDERLDKEEFYDASISTKPENDGSESLLAQSFASLACILPSVPTHFPITFEPPPSPSLPPLNPNLPAFANVLELHPFIASPLLEAAPSALFPDPAANITYAPSPVLAHQRLRTLAQFLAAFWTQAQQLKTIPEIQAWLQAQAEYESLQLRPNLEALLGEAFTEQIWPWPAVLGVAELLDWGTIGNLVNNALNQSVQLAHLQQRAALTRKPRWYQLFSKSAAAYFLLTPFSWPKTLLSALLPRTQQIDALMDEVAGVGVDPSLVFNSQQIEFQRKLRRIDFNLPRLSYALVRLVGSPLLFSLLFISLDWAAPLVGLTFGIACFTAWAGFVANRLLFRAIWMPSLSGAGSKVFWQVFGITLAIACMSAALPSSTPAILLSGFLLLAVAQSFLLALGSGALGCFSTLLISAALSPTQAPDKFFLILPITLNLISLCVYFYQRRMPTEKLLERLTKPTLRLKPVAAAPAAINFNWWWIIAGIALMRLFAGGH